MNESAILLIIEDDPDDSFLLQRALRKHGVQNPIEIIDTMPEAICRLKAHKNATVPMFVIINLAMFLSAGSAVMRWIRDEAGLQEMPVVAIGNSDREEDIQHAYDLGANAYFAKRVDVDELAKLIQELQFFNPVSFRPERAS